MLRLGLFVGAGVALALFSCDLRRRVHHLDAHPYIGPVDWATVMASSDLLSLAWKLSRDARFRAGNYVSSEELSDLPLLGARPGDVSADLEYPLTYENNCLQLTLILKNRSSNAVIVPPTHQGFCYISSSDPESQSGWYIEFRSILGTGGRVLRPGATMKWRIPIPASDCASPELVWIRAVSEEYVIKICNRYEYSPGVEPRVAWEDVPQSDVLFRQIDYKTALAEIRERIKQFDDSFLTEFVDGDEQEEVSEGDHR